MLENLSREELFEMARKLVEIDEANKARSLERYLDTVNEAQVPFHKSRHRGRFFMGGNRSGKTTGGVVECLWRALGRHPFTPGRLPSKGVIILQDHENHNKKIIEAKFLQWAPPGSIIKSERNQNGAWTKLYFATGSTIEILSHDQDIKVFEGGDWDWAWFDEPPPERIWTAIWRGLTDREGCFWITATPITEPWMYAKVKRALDGDPLFWAIVVDHVVNAKNIGEGDEELGRKRLDAFVNELHPDERAARKAGEFLQMRGLIFKDWKRTHHLIKPFLWPAAWPIIESIDPHPHKPWAASWIGLTPSKQKILIRSGYYPGDIEQIAQQLLMERAALEIERNLPPRITRCLIDNSASVPLWQKSNTDPTARRRSVREELEGYIGPTARGPRVEVAPKNVKAKIDLFKVLLHIKATSSGPSSGFYAFDSSENEGFVTEIESYVWDAKRGGLMNGLKDTPRKIGDDIIDTVLQTVLTLPREGQAADVITRSRGNSYRI